jgi:hypothetical protein
MFLFTNVSIAVRIFIIRDFFIIFFFIKKFAKFLIIFILLIATNLAVSAIIAYTLSVALLANQN